ncbi:RING finger protein [Hibiscus syriacus]|uniref:RING finger protein n=1 Tax=Hibiscus syriacus TaxID=106335 RepID=A0A6A3BJB7_HIBSY|nr:RING finger protein [Hibiscus syriacus]
MELLSLLGNASIRVDADDQCVWTGNGEGVYLVKSCVRLMSEGSAEDPIWLKLVWIGYATPRVEVFMWQVFHQKVVKSELLKCGVNGIENTLCPLCGVHQEPSPPPMVSLKINVDGAVQRDWESSGIGGILRNEEGKVLGSFSASTDSGPPILAELKAIQAGLALVEESKWCGKGRLIVESDSVNAVKWIKNPNLSVNWEADSLAKAGIAWLACQAGRRRAVQYVNGTLIDGKRVSVGVARYKKDRRSEPVGKNYQWEGNKSIREVKEGGLEQDAVEKQGGHEKNEGFEVKLVNWGYVRNDCIVMFNSNEEFVEAWSNRQEKLSSWFHWVSPLLNEGGVSSAYCLVELVGLPFLCWSEHFLEKLAGTWGEFVSIMEETRKREDLSAARLLLRVASPFDVPEFTNVGSYGRSFKVKINSGSKCTNFSIAIEEEWKKVSVEGYCADPSKEEEDGSFERNNKSGTELKTNGLSVNLVDGHKADFLKEVVEGSGAKQYWVSEKFQLELDPTRDFASWAERGCGSQLFSPFRFGLGGEVSGNFIEKSMEGRQEPEVNGLGEQIVGSARKEESSKIKVKSSRRWKLGYQVSKCMSIRSAQDCRRGCGRFARVYRRSRARRVWLCSGIVKENLCLEGIQNQKHNQSSGDMANCQQLSLRIRENGLGFFNNSSVPVQSTSVVPLVSSSVSPPKGTYSIIASCSRKDYRRKRRGLISEALGLAEISTVYSSTFNKLLEEALETWDVCQMLGISFKEGREAFIKKFLSLEKGEEGSKGGLISLWNENVFNVSNHHVHSRFLALVGNFMHDPKEFVFINVYGPAIEDEKEDFFRELLNFVMSWNLPVCIGGDFNAYLDAEEKLGKSQNWHTISIFRSFVQQANMMDLPMSGGNFTWCSNREVSTWVRLDRFLICGRFLNSFPKISQALLSKSISDHNPVLLEDVNLNWGPKPFRFFNFLLQEQGFNSFVGKLLAVEKNKINNGGIFRGEWDQLTEFKELWRLLRIEESIWCQKSRSRWIKNGDRNTRFFHLSALKRSRVNCIHTLNINGELVSDKDKIRGGVFNFFNSAYNSNSALEVKDLNFDFAQLTASQSGFLEAEFSELEVWQVISSSDSSKAPGPDDFSMGFFKKYWNFLKEQIMVFFSDFYMGKKWAHGVNHAFITLIPKKGNPEKIEDYRPISLFAFIPGRQQWDCAFIANEGIDSWRKQGLKGVVFKVDFSRAYDTVEWQIIQRLMKELGFGKRWCSWIAQCISTTSISVLVNGSPTEEFSIAKGLRQGCSLSPLLFNMFADDLIIFCRASVTQIKNVRRVLRIFSVLTGLHLNLSKSKLFGINVGSDILDEWARNIGCSVGSFPTDYLGLPLGAVKNSEKLWDPVFANFNRKLTGWKASSLSMAGRLVLIKSVLSSLPIFFLSIFKMPSSICLRLNSLLSNFLWGGGVDKKKMHWVSWDKVYRPLSVGGLGVTDLSLLNRALLGKWIWKFANDTNSLWKQFLCSKHNVSCHSMDINKNDSWLGEVPLKLLFPRIFVLSSNKLGHVADFGSFELSGWVWNVTTRRNLCDWEVMQLVELLDRLKDIKLIETMDDCMLWDGSDDGLFSVKACRQALSSFHDDSFQWNKCVWLGFVPPRVETFLWQLSHQKVAVRAELLRTGRFLLTLPVSLVRGRLAKWFLAKFPLITLQVDSLIGDPTLADNLTAHKTVNNIVLSWIPPPVDFFKMNVDGAVSSVRRLAGIGGILRDWNRVTLSSFSEKVGPATPILAGLKAIKRGIDFFLSSSWASKGRLIIESDSKTAVEWINDGISSPVFLANFVKDIVYSVSARQVVVRWIPRHLPHKFVYRRILKVFSDLADWLGVGELGLFNFKPSVRPVPLEVHIQASFKHPFLKFSPHRPRFPVIKSTSSWHYYAAGVNYDTLVKGYPGKYYCPRMNSMNKPAYAAICTHSPTKPVLIFVSSRRQTRLTALDIIQYAASDENPRQFLSMPEEDLQMVLSQVTDQNLRHTLQFGIGLHHAGLNDKDRSLVLVCTSTLAWGVNLPAHLVIIKGTEYYDGKTKRYVDFPITDILQMMGRAGRPQYDQHGKAVILVHEPKKSFYKKFLYEPFPVESSLREQLHDHMNAEIVSGTICRKEDAVHYLTWTYLFRRLTGMLLVIITKSRVIWL